MVNRNIDQKGIIETRDRNRQIISIKGKEIIEEYNKNPSLTDICNIFNVDANPLRKFLKKAGVYNPYSKKALNLRSEKVKSTLNEKYGEDVNNISKLHIDKLKQRNALPKSEMPFIEEFKTYSWHVNHYTNKSVKKLVDTEYCYYTGIRFADYFMTEGVNPNDYLKKTIDHKISLLYGFLTGMDPKIIGDVTNLVYCIRYCNSLKSNSNASDSDFQEICRQIRRKLIDAGYEHTQD